MSILNNLNTITISSNLYQIIYYGYHLNGEFVHSQVHSSARGRADPDVVDDVLLKITTGNNVIVPRVQMSNTPILLYCTLEHTLYCAFEVGRRG